MAKQRAGKSKARGNPNWRKGGPSPNPTGKRKRRDAWHNPVTGLGVEGRDKSAAGGVLLNIVGEREARELWRGSDIATRIVESAVNDAIRGGICLKVSTGGDSDKETAELVMAALEDMTCPEFVGPGAMSMIRKARHYRRAYGGAAIFPVINDSAGSLAEPLDEARIQKISHLMLFEPRELQPLTWYTDANDPKFGQVETWQLMPLSTGNGQVSLGYVQIHETRLITCQGKRVTAEEVSGVRQGWGDNVFTAVLSAINSFEQAYGNAGALVQDFAQAVFKMKGLATTTGIGGAMVMEKLELMNYMRSILRAVVIDSEDEFTRETTPIGGVSDLLDRFAYRLASAAEMPVTKLLGMSPGGLNATGDSDADNWDRTVGCEQDDMTPMVERLIRLVLLSSEGPTGGKEPETWSIEWEPLHMPSASEDADTKLKIAQRDEIYYNMGVASEDEIARSHFGGDTFSPDLSLDWETRDAQAETEPGDVDPEATAGAGAASTAAAGASVQQTALNGAQVSSMVEVIKAAIAKEIPRESAAAILRIAFSISATHATELLGPENFEAVAPAPAAAGSGAGAPFGKPSAPPPGNVPSGKPAEADKTTNTQPEV